MFDNTVFELPSNEMRCTEYEVARQTGLGRIDYDFAPPWLHQMQHRVQYLGVKKIIDKFRWQDGGQKVNDCPDGIWKKNKPIK